MIRRCGLTHYPSLKRDRQHQHASISIEKPEIQPGDLSHALFAFSLPLTLPLSQPSPPMPRPTSTLADCALAGRRWRNSRKQLPTTSSSSCKKAFEALLESMKRSAPYDPDAALALLWTGLPRAAVRTRFASSPATRRTFLRAWRSARSLPRGRKPGSFPESRSRSIPATSVARGRKWKSAGSSRATPRPSRKGR